jgi:hypothetical protein
VQLAQLARQGLRELREQQARLEPKATQVILARQGLRERQVQLARLVQLVLQVLQEQQARQEAMPR